MTKTIKPQKAFAFIALIICSYSSCLHAHEYWIDSIKTVVNANSTAFINIRNGENFTGPTYPYNPERVKSISITNNTNTKNYTGRLGDYPAIRPTLVAPGIHSIAIETHAQNLIYNSWEKFTGFLDYHGFDDVEERHLKRGLPKVDVSENYTRSAKTLVQVKATSTQTQLASDTTGKLDHNALMPVGHVFEMVFLEPPFGDIATVQIKLLYKGAPLGNRQAELFWDRDKSSRLTTTTNAEGIATFGLLGEGDYLINAVHLTEATKNNAHWNSHWASITFTQ